MRWPDRRTTARALAAAALALALAAPGALAASPSPTPGQLGDPRAEGTPPGLVGEPGLAIAAVLALGFGTLAATLAWVRLTAARERPRD